MKENNDDLKTIHTYQADVEEAINQNHISKAQVFIAEQEKRTEKSDQKVQTSGLSFNFRSIFIAIIFLIIGGVVIYFFINPPREERILPPPPALTPESAILSYDSFVPTETSVSNGQDLTSLVNNRKQSYSSGVEVLSFDLTSEEFLNLLTPNLSGNFKRSFKSPFAFGLWREENSSDYPQSFLILKIDSFETARGVLLSEEGILIKDVATIFNIPPTVNLQFRDRVINNHDVRVLVDPLNNVYFLYSFINSDTLVFAEGDDTFRVVIDRINSSRR